MYAVRALLLMQIRREFAVSLDHQYQHEAMAVRVYRALASREACRNRRGAYLDWANLADRKARHSAVRLAILRPARTPGHVNLLDRVECWMLLHCRADITIRWMGWTERHDNMRIDALYDAQDFYQGKGCDMGY